ncbi:MAG: hypothetical protein AB7I27_14640 [Bacteriovoracaceae bacterium]
MHSINTENWTYCRFKSGNFMAFISFGANPESIKEDQLEYFVTVLENEEKEVFQQEFDNLSMACLFLNQRYGDWSFEDQTAPKSGCSTCAAH